MAKAAFNEYLCLLRNLEFCSQTKTVLEILQSEWLQVTSINYSTRILEREGPERAQHTM